MEFDRPRTDAEQTTHLLARSTPDNLSQHGFFPKRESLGGRKMRRDFSDGLLQLFDLGCCLFQLRRISKFPLIVPPVDREMMSPYNVGDVQRLLRAQRMGTQNNDLLAGDAAIDLLIVFAKLFPVTGFEPRGITADAETLVAAFKRLIQFRGPATGNALQVKLVYLQVPLLVG